jgi:hypothetical protein
MASVLIDFRKCKFYQPQENKKLEIRAYRFQLIFVKRMDKQMDLLILIPPYYIDP